MIGPGLMGLVLDATGGVAVAMAVAGLWLAVAGCLFCVAVVAAARRGRHRELYYQVDFGEEEPP